MPKVSIQNYPPFFTGHPRTGLKLRVSSIQKLRGKSCSHLGSRMLAQSKQSASMHSLTGSPRRSMGTSYKPNQTFRVFGRHELAPHPWTLLQKKKKKI